VKRLRAGQTGIQITVGESDFSFLGNVHTASCPIGTVVLSREKSSRAVKFTSRLPVMPSLIMSGAISLFHPYAFTEWTTRSLLLPYIVKM
jgi:hypothetical protein